jgi:outer membrane protein assembly factor BamB
MGSVILLVLLGLQEDAPLSRWQLTRDRLQGTAFPPTAGKLEAKMVGGEPRFSEDEPRALLLGRAKSDTPRVEGAASYLLVTNDLSGLPKRSITVEAWAQIGKSQKWGGLVGALQDNGSYEKGWLLGYNETSFFFALAGQKPGKLTYLAASRAYQTGVWYHVVGVYDGKEQRIYVDGRLDRKSAEQSGDIAYPPKAAFVLGAYKDDDETYPLEGRIEQASVWDRALGEAEVRALFDGRKASFPGIEPVRPSVVDWPTHLRDNQRTGLSDEEPKLPLRLQWAHQARLGPAPAWPPPAQRDFWNRVDSIQPRMVFDRAFPLAAVGDRVYFSSSSEDRVFCLDAATGTLAWSFAAEGPVRLAPTVADGRVLFGSDDGQVYCVKAEDGSLLWKLRAVEPDRRIPGNERMISAWPVRTGVLVEDGAAYFCAGLFPSEGVVHVSADLATGKKLGETRVEFAPQGYMERRGGQFFMATGHDLAGGFVAALRKSGKFLGPEVRAIPAGYPYAFIGAGRLRFGGGDGKVAAFTAEDGREAWSAPVEGKAHILAFARGRLLVSTDAGRVYCFSPEEGEARTVVMPSAPVLESPEADRILKVSGVDRGWALVFGDAALAESLARKSRLKVVVADRTPLPYADWLFNLVVGGSGPEVERVLRPYGGVHVAGDRVTRRGPLPGAGEWSHMYADAGNTVSSGEATSGKSYRLQWFGLPGPRGMMDRHHRTMAPLWKEGRLFVPGYDRLYAVDAYNGTVLWEEEIGEFRRVAAFRDSSAMAAAADRIYAASGATCLGLDPATGRRETSFPVPVAGREWGYVAVDGDTLFGTAVRPGASRRTQSREVAGTETYWDFVPAVCSDRLFAMDRKTGEVRWSHAPKGLVPNPTFTIQGGRVYLVESGDPATLDAASGRAKMSDLFSKGARLVALDAKTGTEAWSRDLDLSKLHHNLYLAAAKGLLVAVGSRNDAKKVRYDLHVFDAASGKPVWSKTQEQGSAIGGDHGEQDLHPVIAGDRLICEPYAYVLATGEPLAGWTWEKKGRRGCGTISASAGTLFFRDQTAAFYDLGSGQKRSLTTAARPGCWINLIPAGGLLLMPEASSGCTCSFGVQGSMGFKPE